MIPSQTVPSIHLWVQLCSTLGAYFINSLFPLLQAPFSVVHIARRPPHRDFPLHQVTTKGEKKHIIHMYNILPNTHTCFLCYTMLTTSTAGYTHAHTHTAYYLYEVLYTSDHQHRVSVFSNPHSGWIDRSMQWKDYTDGLMGVLIWVIVSALVNKNRCRKEYRCFYTIVLNVYVLATVLTIITHSHCELVPVLSEWSWTE